jgi:hypothetical protein
VAYPFYKSLCLVYSRGDFNLIALYVLYVCLVLEFAGGKKGGKPDNIYNVLKLLLLKLAVKK